MFKVLSSNVAQFPIHTLVLISIINSLAYFHLLDIIRSGELDVTSSYSGQVAVSPESYVVGRVSNRDSGEWNWSQIVDKPDLIVLQLTYPVLTRRTGEKIIAAFDSECYKINGECQTFTYPTTSTQATFQILLNRTNTAGVYEKAKNLELTGLRYEKTVIASPVSRPDIIWLGQVMSDMYHKTVELIRNASSIDIIIIAIGYMAMYSVFVSLFINMRTLGSSFWLASTVLMSSIFAFIFALVTVNALGRPINPILLSEGLPFLVVTIGFEKPFLLTKAVLSTSPATSTRPIREDVVKGVHLKGFSILRDYFFEIAILVVGASSGVNGLKQFCFLASFILAYDCILLFTFYTAILSIKLEILRFKRHTGIRKALEEEGMSYKKAEKVACANDPRGPGDRLSTSFVDNLGMFSLFGGAKVKDSSIWMFKVFMVSIFIVGNFLNVSPINFSGFVADSGDAHAMVPMYQGPLHLAALLNRLSSRGGGYSIAVIAPLRFANTNLAPSLLVKFLEGWTRMVGDPVLSKGIVVILIMSIMFNAYLFNAARGSMSQSMPATPAIVEKEVVKYVDRFPGLSPRHASDTPPRSLDACYQDHLDGKTKKLTDEELTVLVLNAKISPYALEKLLGDMERAVRVRRAYVSRTSISKTLEKSEVPLENYDYARVMGACCESVIGYMPLPLGVAGPLLIDGISTFIPMATTEGCLVASTQRGCKAMNSGGGVVTVLTADGMTRGPCVTFPSIKRAGAAKMWLDSESGQKQIKAAFNSTSRFARLQSTKAALAGTNMFIRFKTTTGDAMGMNMISKGVEAALKYMSEDAGFTDMQIISLSGNYCTDKKPAAINWIEGRGKSVVAESIIPGSVVKSVLKSSVEAMVDLNIKKNLIGSAMAGSIGGFNAHAANILTAIFLATGQDPAQNVESSQCMTLMDNVDGNLHITVSMPCIEVGTIGGGTILGPQGAMLDLLGVRGPHPTQPG